MNEDNQPKGIGFFNIKSGETRYARLEAQIQAYINSSDIGINASRDQDFGWRLAPEWVKKVKEFRRNESKMQFLTDRNGGQKVTTPQILYSIYGEQLRAAQERADEEETPFEEEYLANISSKPEAAVQNVDEEDLAALDEGVDNGDQSGTSDNTENIAKPREEVNAASDSDQSADSKAKPATTKKK